MTHSSYLAQAKTVFRALRLAKVRARRQRWSRDRLLAFQRQRLGELVAYASRHSAFYRKLYGGELAAHEVELERLPTTSKAAMMAGFDELVTDPRLKLEQLQAHLRERPPESLHLGEYAVLSTSGSSGLRGVFALSRAEWLEVMGTYFASGDITGVRPSLPRQRVLVVSAPDAKHVSYRQSATADIGLYRLLRQPASVGIDTLAARARLFGPDGILGYPSVVSMLAQEHLAGRWRISPRWVITGAELRTEEMTDHIRAAWGIDPFNSLGMTEAGSVAADCSAHAGMHVLEDSVILENVDARGEPVPPGTPGARLLLTNLWLRTQPLIRYEVSDLVAFDERPCSCGRTSTRIVAIEGRADDVLDLPTPAGATVPVHPVCLRSPIAALSDVAQYQIVQHGAALAVNVVPVRRYANDGLSDEVQRTIERALSGVGVASVPVDVRVVDRLERAGGGKLKLVERRRALPPV